ncbi:MAG: hypothetical protein IPP71_14230 [Bacteroidetes bacterium]|nr:hypothetical protein [Bacteroidota bacterium]
MHLTLKYLASFFFFFLLIIGISSCKKDEILTDSSVKLEFSTDTIMFDTVFSSLGSTTKQLKIYNRNNRPIRISSIRLAGGAPSTFRLNVDGIPGKSFFDVEIPEKDSLFVFVEVTVNPNGQLTPFIFQDSILFEINGNKQDVDLVAFGQNARFIVADKFVTAGSSAIPYALLDTQLNATITWDNVLPYVIWGGYALVDSSQTLIIQPGTKIYFGNSAGIWVYRGGTIKVLGTVNDPVKMKGVRLESYYQDIPGQWDRVWINEGSTNNEINYAEISNGFIGVHADTPFDTSDAKKLMIRNTIIKNMSGFGILSRYYKIEVKNTLIARCGQYAFLAEGGECEFRHCTLANYWNDGQRNTPSVSLRDYTISGANAFNYKLRKANFFNCIIWGNNDEEYEIGYEFGNDTIESFNHVLLKTELNLSAPYYTNMILNQNPQFVNFSEDDYQLQSISPAVNAGDPAFIDADLINDLLNYTRDASPDLGAYEFH